MILGAQFYTLKDFCKTLDGLEESFKKVADMGITAIQLSGVCEYEPEWALEKAKENGLDIVITHTKFDKLVNETEAVIEFHKRMNCHYIGVGGLPVGEDMDDAKVERGMELMIPAAKKIAAAGFQFMYHNHAKEFARQTPEHDLYINRIMDALTPDELGITLDTYWVQAGGGDPAQWIMKTAGRNDCVHFKDMVFDRTEKKIHIAPIGEGNMNYDSIIEACQKAAVKYGFIELDNCYGEDPFACMERSYKYLTSRYGLK